MGMTPRNFHTIPTLCVILPTMHKILPVVSSKPIYYESHSRSFFGVGISMHKYITKLCTDRLLLIAGYFTADCPQHHI